MLAFCLNHCLNWRCRTQIPVSGKLQVLTKTVLMVIVAVVSVIINCNFHKSHGLNLEEFSGNFKNHFNFERKNNLTLDVSSIRTFP